MKRKNNKKVTPEGLAGMIKRSFDKVYQRFNKMDERFDRVDSKLDNIVYRNEFEELEERVKTLEQALVINSKK